MPSITTSAPVHITYPHLTSPSTIPLRPLCLPSSLLPPLLPFSCSVAGGSSKIFSFSFLTSSTDLAVMHHPITTDQIQRVLLISVRALKQDRTSLYFNDIIFHMRKYFLVYCNLLMTSAKRVIAFLPLL